jgi:Cytochrome P450
VSGRTAAPVAFGDRCPMIARLRRSHQAVRGHTRGPARCPTLPACSSAAEVRGGLTARCDARSAGSRKPRSKGSSVGRASASATSVSGSATTSSRRANTGVGSQDTCQICLRRSALPVGWAVATGSGHSVALARASTDATFRPRGASRSRRSGVTHSADTRRVTSTGFRSHPETSIGGHEIPAGRMVLYSPYVTRRLPELWPEPSAFRPERWLPQTRVPQLMGT